MTDYRKSYFYLEIRRPYHFDESNFVHSKQQKLVFCISTLSKHVVKCIQSCNEIWNTRDMAVILFVKP